MAKTSGLENAPSKTGNPSGKKRGNKPPKKSEVAPKANSKK